MTAFVVLSRPAAGSDPDIAVVPDRFTWLGFFFSVVWLLFHRVWLYAAGLLVVEVAAAYLAGSGGDWAPLGFAISLLAGLYVGLEGQAWRVDAMTGRGYRIVDVVEAPDGEMAAEIHIRRAAAGPTPPPLPPASPRAAAGPSQPALFGLVAMGGEGRS